MKGSMGEFDVKLPADFGTPEYLAQMRQFYAERPHRSPGPWTLERIAQAKETVLKADNVKQNIDV